MPTTNPRGWAVIEDNDDFPRGANLLGKDAANDLTTVENALTTGLYLKAPLASPAFTGTPTAPTAIQGTNTTQLATTAFVVAAVAALVNSAPGALDTLKELADAIGDDANFAATVTNALALKAPLASPALTGTPTAPTASAGTNTTQLATTAFVAAAIAALVNSAPTTLDTLKEIADQLAADESAATAILNALTTHTGNTSNPHNVTKTQIGLPNVDNTSDSSKQATFQTAYDTRYLPISAPVWSGLMSNLAVGSGATAFHVQKSGGVGYLKIVQTGNSFKIVATETVTGNSAVELYADGLRYWMTSVGIVTGGSIAWGSGGSGEKILSNSNGLNFYAGASERLTILSGGKVGINQTSPSAQFHVTNGATGQAGLMVDAVASQTEKLFRLRAPSSTQTRNVASIDATLPTTTDATRTGRVIHYVSDYSAEREVWRGEADGTQAKIGFLGASAIGKRTLSAAATDAATTQTLVNDLRQLFIDLGLAQ